MATWYVDTDYTGGTTDGGLTTPYKTLAAAVAAKKGVLSEPCIFSCKGAAADTTRVTISEADYTTSAANYIEVTTPVANRHTGTFDDTNVYRLKGTGGSTGVLEIAANYVRLTGIQIYGTAPAADYDAVMTIATTISGASVIHISQCIIRGAGSASYIAHGISSQTSASTIHIWNTIILHPTTYSYGTALGLSGTATANIYNCTIISKNGIYRNAGTVTAKNTYCSHTTGGEAFGGTITKVNCASSDATAGSSDGCVSNVLYDTTEGSGHAGFTNVGAGTEDFHLKSGSYLIGKGADGPFTAPLDYTTDIAGTTRS